MNGIIQACRRQAPAWLVSALFSSYPESAYEKTQFGELPLHLAVESGAAPEVVNLIMVANWSAIVTADNSGRIPTDILDRGELLLLDEHRIVHESLSRCHRAYTNMQKEVENERAELVRTHKRELSSAKRQHQETLDKEHDIQNSIRREVVELEAGIEDMKKVSNQKDHMIEEHKAEIQTWTEKAQTLTTTIELLQQELANEKKKMRVLAKELEEKGDEISERDELIEILTNDLRTVSTMHEEDLMESVRNAERTMRAMVSSQLALQKQLTGQASGIKALLCARGIDLPTVDSTFEQEEKEHHEEPLDTQEAASALAAAAIAALKPSLSAL